MAIPAGYSLDNTPCESELQISLNRIVANPNNRTVRPQYSPVAMTPFGGTASYAVAL